VTQSGAPEDFSLEVPVEIQFAKSKPLRRWVRTGPEAEGFLLKVRERPTRVVLDPDNAVLKR